MSANEAKALGLLARLAEDRPNIDCPIEQGQQLLGRIYGDEEARQN